MSIRTAARLILGYAALVESGAAMVRFRERTVAFMSAMERATARSGTLGCTHGSPVRTVAAMSAWVSTAAQSAR